VISRIELHPEALAEMEEAAAWYEARRPGLGLEFVAEIERLLARVADNPEAFSVWNASDPSRRAVCARFPYSVFFDLESARILVLAVAHARRRPGYWLGREGTGP
jgi:toxin ParE1/3/4